MFAVHGGGAPLAGGLVKQRGVALVEGAALDVLPGQPHAVVALVQPQGRLQC